MARILVVDDDRAIVHLVRHRLERSGHSVIGFSSPQEALEILLKEKPPDLAILDVSMPGIDGMELLETLRAGLGTTIPAIFLSAKASPEAIAAGQALGATYLTKPFVASALMKAIQELLP